MLLQKVNNTANNITSALVLRSAALVPSVGASCFPDLLSVNY